MIKGFSENTPEPQYKLMIEPNMNAGLMDATRDGRTEDVVKLLAEGSDVNTQDSECSTPLMEACEGGHEEVAQLLLEAGAIVDQPDIEGFTPLILASQEGPRRWSGFS